MRSVWLNATCVKVREAGRIVSVAVTIAVGVNSDGRREVLGMAVGASEADGWMAPDRHLRTKVVAVEHTTSKSFQSGRTEMPQAKKEG